MPDNEEKEYLVPNNKETEEDIVPDQSRYENSETNEDK